MWRSALFVPVLEKRFIDKAQTRGADAIVLDLEASITFARKDEARETLPTVVEQLSSGPADLIVRINVSRDLGWKDLNTAACQNVRAIMIPQCDDADYLREIAEFLDIIERERSIEPGYIRLICLIESPRAVLEAYSLCSATKRITAASLGNEDFATAMGTSTNPDLINNASYQICLAARSSGITPMVLPGTFTSLHDLESFEASAQIGKRLGAEGAFAIHPNQIEVLNRVFYPTKEEIVFARQICDAAAKAEKMGSGVVALDGEMIDLPIIKRAEKLLSRL